MVAVFELADVNLTSGPGILASSVLLPVLELALVNITTGPGILASPVFLPVLVLALVNFTTGRCMLASSTHLVVLVLALINTAVRKSACTHAVAFAASQVSVVNPRFFSFDHFVLQGAQKVQPGEERGVTGVLTWVTYLVPGGAQPAPATTGFGEALWHAAAA
jgi:hypothetical protein